jgi:mannosyltransferase OCH1-like enzyme
MPRSITPQVQKFPLGTSIPKLIHQTFSNAPLPDILARNIENLKALNPGWRHCFYNDDDIIAFIIKEYGHDMLHCYEKINPRYGAARADLFRYLLLYRFGGVYLDIKSTATLPLDTALSNDELYILSHWKNELGAVRQSWGKHPELEAIEHGEYQQWHIICVAGHPFLEAVINEVVSRIASYRPWRERLGQQAVIRTTGPIAYTLAIAPLRPHYPHRLIRNEEEIGLQYSIMPDHTHAPFFKSHYVSLLEPLVRMKGMALIGTVAYLRARLIRDRLLHILSHMRR